MSHDTSVKLLKKKNCSNQSDPLVTFALLSFNQESFIDQAIKGAFSQDYKWLEIIISDDCSQDSTYKRILEATSKYNGSHQIKVNRNDSNLGLTCHFNKIMSLSQGSIIVVAAGDDISLPNRVSKTVSLLNACPSAVFVSFSDVLIDEEGKEIKQRKTKKISGTRTVSLKDFISGKSGGGSGASRGFRRCLYSEFGNLNIECPTEDTPYLLRGLILGDGLISPEPGIFYRRHSKNLSSPASMINMNFAEIKKQYLQDIKKAEIKGLLAPEVRNSLIGWVEKNYRRKLIQKKAHDTRLFSTEFLKLIFFDRSFNSKEKVRIIKKIR